MAISKVTAMPKQALVVEDDPSVRKMVRGFLVHMKYVVTEAPDGNKALAALSSQKFDLVLLDLMLPEDRAHAEELGARPYLIKPFSRSDFSQAIRAVVDGAR